MKRILYIALAIMAMYSCEKIAPQKLTLVVDRTSVEASGVDYVTFQLIDSTGVDLLADKATLQSVNIVSEEGMRVPRMSSKTSFIANGTYNFKATYKGQTSGNTVQIIAGNRGKYEKYHKNVAIYKATATWCGPCALMTKALGNLNEDTENHTVELCWHYQDDLAITVSGSNDCGTMIASAFGNGGVPTVVLDLQETVIEKSSSAIETAAWELRAKYPATCGIKVSSFYDEGSNEIKLNAELTSSTGGEYDLGAVLMLNDQVISSGTNEGGKYTHIVRAATPNYMMYSKSIKEVEKDETISFVQNIKLGTMSYSDKLSVAVFALVKEGEGSRIDNIVEAKVGETVDYVYNE